jgi:hypothetical protein
MNSQKPLQIAAAKNDRNPKILFHMRTLLTPLAGFCNGHPGIGMGEARFAPQHSFQESDGVSAAKSLVAFAP